MSALFLQSELNRTRPDHIEPQHWQEWLSSRVDPGLIAANVRSLEATEAYDFLCYSDQLERTNTGRLASRWLNAYGHVEAGGWWCNGLDPLNDWQPMLWGTFKPNCPRLPFEPGKKPIKYESPAKVPTRAFFLVVPDALAEQIYQRYGVVTTEEDRGQGFWFVAWKYGIPVVIVEGCKKAACLLSNGYCAIALPGINSGYRSKDASGKAIPRYLIEDVKCFATAGREVILAFDQDAKLKTRFNVNGALFRFGCLLQNQGCTVRIATWEAADGKGPDDLVVNRGSVAWDQAYTQAMTLEHWKLWNRLENRLTYPASIRLKTQDLSTLEIGSLPESGIIALASAKGTGKTKFIGSQIASSPKTILGGHRICLMRNLCQRLGVDYKGDLDKAQGEFISGKGYTLRVGLCLDSFLAINPAKFAGCDLVLDETTQVLRHLLTSQTCKKAGMLPALLARFHEIVRVSKRVILADADLDNACLDYIRELRGDSELTTRNAPVFLIRNDYQPLGYPVRFIQAPNASVITAELLRDVGLRQPGEVILVQTDSKTGSKTLARLVEQIEGLGCRLLLLNSETSGEEAQREFISNPDAVLAQRVDRPGILQSAHSQGKYDVIIASPSMATGVSIEVQGIISKVYSLSYGVSSIDSEISQSLFRVRSPVPRVVWCAERGSNFSKAGRYSNRLQLKAALKSRTDAAISLIRSNLREDTTGALAAYDWQSDPHLNLWAKIEAERNASMWSLRDALLVRLRHEGHQVTVVNCEEDQESKELLKQARQAIKQQEAQAIANARVLSNSEAEELRSRDGLSPDDQLAMARYYLGDFYVLPEVTPDLVLWDKSGRRRGQLLNLEAQLAPETAIERDVNKLTEQLSWKQGVVPWDLGTSELKRRTREFLGLHDFFDPAKEWTAADLKPYADRARNYAHDIKTALNFSIRDSVSDVQIIHQLLSQMGVKTKFRWQRIDGEKIRIYSLDAEHWQVMTEVVERRQQRRESFKESSFEVGSPPPNYSYRGGGDPGTYPEKGSRRMALMTCYSSDPRPRFDPSQQVDM